jgi:AcrR family transcriptional regulator
MSEAVNKQSSPRRYRAPKREAAALATREAVLSAARELFTSLGYASTTVTAIAERAGVSVDTVYVSVGRKPALMRELVETSISGQAQAVPALERDYVAQVRAASDAREKLAIYAASIVRVQQRLAPIFLALREAGATDESCRSLWKEISERRASNMRLFAADLRSTGQVRADLSDDEVADIVWSLNSSEYFVLLVHERGWTPERFEGWLRDAWIRLLLAPVTQ